MKGFDSVYVKDSNKTEGLNLKFKKEYEGLIN
ncbi:hypothetical protein FORC47_p372 (plasmid) [Bacillus cereus]|nr:hypothetical protein FORC47_p372 [Bacillus cereus]